MFRGDETGPVIEGESRGQTTLDFAIGISLFLGVVLFIFLFVPGILEPFTVGAQDETVTVNRVADDLTQGLLAAPERPNVLRVHCTTAFFEETSGVCGLDGADLNEFVGVTDRQLLNVSVRGNVSAGDTDTELLCWEINDEKLVERDGDGAADGSCDPGTDTVLAGGDTPPTGNSDAVTATRVVDLAGSDVTVRVVMW